MAAKVACNSDPVEQRPKGEPLKGEVEKEEPQFESLDSSRWVFYTQCVASVLLVQVLFLGDSLWIHGDDYACARGLWLLLVNGALLFFDYSMVGKKAFRSNKTFALTWSAILLHLGLLVLWRHLVGVDQTTIWSNYRVLLFPYIVAPLITSFLMNARVGAFVTVAVTMLGFGIVESSLAMYYGVFSLAAGMAAVLLADKARKRSAFYRAGWVCGVVVVVLGLILVGPLQELMLTNIGTGFKVLAGAFAVSFILAVVISGFMPGIEALFRITTPISWLEFADLNHELLKRLQLEAPGTYHHSTKVSLLAEAAAEKIGANADFCRVGALYHDVGKIGNPQYFIENLSDTKNNPHNLLDPKSSAIEIIKHVKDGCKLGQQYKLNREIMAAIKQHHGVSLVYVFYRKALDRYNEEVAKGPQSSDDDPNPVRKEDYMYPGPIPQSREVAIISLADIVESATRSLKNPTEDQLRDMINDLINKRILEGHLDGSGLTLGDIVQIKESFMASLKSMDHNRISYPKDDDETSVAKAEEKPAVVEKPAVEEAPAKEEEPTSQEEAKEEPAEETQKAEDEEVDNSIYILSSATPIVQPKADGLPVEELTQHPIPGQIPNP
jgi:hypothetical protein